MAALCVAGMALSSCAIEANGIDPGVFAFDAPRQLLSGHPIVMVALTPVPIEPDSDAAISLRDVDGIAFGPKLSDGQFCELAAAGSGVIGDATYRVVGTSRDPSANCRRYFSRLARKMPVAAGALGRSVFEKINAPHGLGAERFRLVPWRSVAAARFTLGTVLFIPALRGQRIDLERQHDGYVFVADRLGDAPPARISLVVDRKRPPPALPLGTIVGHVVDSAEIRKTLQRLHAIQ